MKILKTSEIIPEVINELQSHGLLPVTFTKEDGTQTTGYIVDDDGLFWGIKVKSKS